MVQFYPALSGLPAPADDPYPALRDFVLAYRDQITAIVATRLVQTNEPARSSYLYPALLTAQRLGDGGISESDVIRLDTAAVLVAQVGETATVGETPEVPAVRWGLAQVMSCRGWRVEDLAV